MSSPFAKRSLRERLRGTTFACRCLDAGLPTVASERSERLAKVGTGTGIRTPVPWLRNAAGDLDGLRLRRFCWGFRTDLWVA